MPRGRTLVLVSRCGDLETKGLAGRRSHPSFRLPLSHQGEAGGAAILTQGPDLRVWLPLPAWQGLGLVLWRLFLGGGAGERPRVPGTVRPGKCTQTAVQGDWESQEPASHVCTRRSLHVGIHLLPLSLPPHLIHPGFSKPFNHLTNIY